MATVQTPVVSFNLVAPGAQKHREEENLCNVEKAESNPRNQLFLERKEAVRPKRWKIKSKHSEMFLYSQSLIDHLLQQCDLGKARPPQCPEGQCCTSSWALRRGLR